MIVRRGKSPIRRGAAMVEAAIILPLFLTLCLGMIDLGIAVFQNNAVAEASRQGARIASVHGSLAPSGWNGGAWGSTAWSGAGNSSNVIATTISGAGTLAGLNPANVTISLSWPTGNSVQHGDTVVVTVSTNWTPIISYVFGSRTVTLSATSIMPIAH
jgi:Flp pilus assembly protein TadG